MRGGDADREIRHRGAVDGEAEKTKNTPIDGIFVLFFALLGNVNPLAICAS
jgi:hypothetical protein